MMISCGRKLIQRSLQSHLHILCELESFVVTTGFSSCVDSRAIGIESLIMAYYIPTQPRCVRLILNKTTHVKLWECYLSQYILLPVSPNCQCQSFTRSVVNVIPPFSVSPATSRNRSSAKSNEGSDGAKPDTTSPRLSPSIDMHERTAHPRDNLVSPLLLSQTAFLCRLPLFLWRPEECFFLVLPPFCDEQMGRAGSLHHNPVPSIENHLARQFLVYQTC